MALPHASREFAAIALHLIDSYVSVEEFAKIMAMSGIGCCCWQVVTVMCHELCVVYYMQHAFLLTLFFFQLLLFKLSILFANGLFV